MVIDGAVDVTITFAVVSTDAVYAALTIAPLTITNADDDALGFTVTSAGAMVVREGGESAGYTAQLTATPLTPVTLQITTDGQSEVSRDGSTFAANLAVTLTDTTPAALQVRAVDDGVTEAITQTSTISHVLQSGDELTAATLLTTTATLTVSVVDNDRAQVGVRDGSAVEAASALTFTVVMTGSVDGPVTVDYATQEIAQQADAGVDYVPVTGTLTFTSTGPAVQTVTVPLLDDAASEGDETVALTLGNVTPTDRAIDLNLRDRDGRHRQRRRRGDLRAGQPVLARGVWAGVDARRRAASSRPAA
ncbi:MAG: Calx-beta domain-containing protein [Caldilineaceae bacterium]